jgi:hypothetical protein
MFERIVRGWRIMKASGGVLARHPKLVVFPLLSLVALAGLVAAIVIPVAASPQLAATEEIFDSVRADEPLLYIALFALYFVLTLIVVFFNAALVFCALESFAGRKPSLRGGLSAAVGRLPQILAWTFVSTTVGLLLNALQGILDRHTRLHLLGPPPPPLRPPFRHLEAQQGRRPGLRTAAPPRRSPLTRASRAG